MLIILFTGCTMDVAEQVATPTISVVPVLNNPPHQRIIMDCATYGATIFWTAAASPAIPAVPTASSTQYLGPAQIDISSSYTFRVFAQHEHMIDSDVLEYTVSIPTAVATPTAIPLPGPAADGTYVAAQSIYLSSAVGATIYYTDDGTEPNEKSHLYTGPIYIEKTTTVRAIAVKSGMLNSTVMTATYTFAITATPVAGTYTETQNVSLSNVTPGAEIYYTLDGTAPDQSSTLYINPIPIIGTTTLKAIAIKDGAPVSAVLTATYTITP